jgi:hypothetical protein
MKQILVLGLFLLLFSSCSDTSPLYFDSKTQAIVSCNGIIKEIDIETPQSTVIFYGPVSGTPVYIGKQNPAYVVRIDGEEQSDYILKLQPNTTYIVRTERGDDKDPGSLRFTTNADGIIFKASKTNCSL